MSKTTLHNVKLAAAALVAVMGVFLGLRAMGVKAPWTASSRPSPVPAPAPVEPEREIYKLDAAQFDVQATEDNIDEVADRLRDAIRAKTRAAPQGAALGQELIEALASEASEEFKTYLVANFDRYLERLYSRGGRFAMLDNAEDKEAMRQKQESFWRSTAEPVALRPISIDELIVRPRYVDGREIPPAVDLQSSNRVESDDRYDIPRDAEKNRLTIFEVVLPVHFKGAYMIGGQRMDTESPAWWGVWWAIHPETRQWIPWRMAMYGGAPYGPTY